MKDYKTNFSQKIIEETLFEIRFVFHVYSRLVESNEEAEKLNNFRKRLKALMNMLELRVDDFPELLLQNLKSDEKQTVTASAYVLSTLKSHQQDSSYLGFVISEFLKGDKKQRHLLSKGLKQGGHPLLSTKLHDTSAKIGDEIREECQQILKYREQRVHND